MAQFIAGRKPLPKAQRRTKRIRFQTDTRLSGSQIYPRLQRLFRQSDDPENMREQGWAWAEGEGVRTVEVSMTESEYDLLGSLAGATRLSKAAILRGAVRGDTLIALDSPATVVEPGTNGTPHPNTP